MIETIRWGVIGVGRFGLIHAGVLSTMPRVELAALCNRNENRLKDARNEFDVAACFTDYRELLADPSIDAVSITTHWRQHAEIALAALRAGKHVLLEKPMAATGEQCREIVATAETARGKFMVGHVCRFDPRVTLAKQAIDDGRIGRIISMHAKRNLPRAPGNIRLDKISPLMGDGIHDADLMLWMMGKSPTSIYARNVRVDEFEHPDIGWAMLEFGSQATGVIETNWRLPENVPTVIDAKMEVVGTDGLLSIDCANTGLTVLDEKGFRKPDTAYWPIQQGKHIGALTHEIEYFAECIRRDKTPSVITSREAARAVMVMEAAELSASRGQVVSFEEPF